MFQDPCSGKTLIKEEVKKKYENYSVGDLTIEVLDEHMIKYKGSEKSMIQIFGSPIGDKAFKIVDDETLLAFGWCYSIDGVIPDKYPDEVLVSKKIKKIRWFYGSSKNYKNKWVDMCKFAYNLSSDLNPACEKPLDESLSKD